MIQIYQDILKKCISLNLFKHLPSLVFKIVVKVQHKQKGKQSKAKEHYNIHKNILALKIEIMPLCTIPKRRKLNGIFCTTVGIRNNGLVRYLNGQM